ncbi:MAG: hypothetical protein ACRD6X_13950 [Pyrinomonadaceae bacterium]
MQDFEAVGWSADPDSPASSNFVDCYVDGQFSNQITADLPGTGAPNPPYTGNHRFSFSIPTLYRDGQDHQLTCHGIDLSGGDPNAVLAGSPKTFNIPPAPISTTFVPLTQGALTLNSNPGGGLRIFPERSTPTGPVNNIVNVKAKIGVNVANIPVYLYAHDLDDPSAEGPPIDFDFGGRDNRSFAQIGDLCPFGSTGCEFYAPANAIRAFTNSSGEVVVPFRLTGAHPGDNYAISVTTDINETQYFEVQGTAIRNSVTGRVLQEGIDRSPMLTAWRTLHIERDSMGIIANEALTNVASEQIIRTRPVNVPVLSQLEPEQIPGPNDPPPIYSRFENGRMRIEDGRMLRIKKNSLTSLDVFYPLGIASVRPGILYRLYDDDDFNSDNSLNGIDGDHGEDVEALSDTYNLLQENDDADCSDKDCNIFAAAYIQPDFSWGDQFSTSNIFFVQNVNNNANEIDGQIDLGRYTNSGENDDFWVAYIQIAYQHSIQEDCDPNLTCTGGVTVGSGSVNDVSNESSVPTGSQGSLLYIEVMRDADLNLPLSGYPNFPFSRDYKIRATPHEIGHQFGLRGDDSEPINFGVMSSSGPLGFIDRHLNVIRWRRKSPGT